jgi:hypothetical protein
MSELGMSARIVGITIEAEAVEIYASADGSRRRARRKKAAVEDVAAHQFPTHQFPVRQFPLHQFPKQRFPAKGGAGTEQAVAEQSAEPHRGRAEEEDREREQRTYRGRTVGMLRRYLRYSIEAGRLPSVLGSEFFRAKVTTYTVVTFEDRVIFVHDMEKCLDRLDNFSRQLIARHILQEHDQAASGRLLGCTERTVRTYIPIVLDLFSDILLEVGLMKRVVSDRGNSCPNSCQGGLENEITASDCEDGKYKV